MGKKCEVDFQPRCQETKLEVEVFVTKWWGGSYECINWTV